MSSEKMFSQECVVILAYLNYLKTLNGKHSRRPTKAELVKAANRKLPRPEKSHRPERVRGPLKPPKYTLKELVDQITEDNIHEEVDTGPAVGNEVWWD